jgi:hypothetical protein
LLSEIPEIHVVDVDVRRTSEPPTILRALPAPLYNPHEEGKEDTGSEGTTPLISLLARLLADSLLSDQPKEGNAPTEEMAV